MKCESTFHDALEQGCHEMPSNWQQNMAWQAIPNKQKQHTHKHMHRNNRDGVRLNVRI